MEISSATARAQQGHGASDGLGASDGRPEPATALGAPWACRVCGSPAAVVCPGKDEVRFGRILVARGRDDVAHCLAHTQAIGWPWRSERGARHG